MEKKSADNIETAASRYQTSIERLRDFITLHKVSDKDLKLNKTLTSHIPTLNTLRDNFPANSAFWLLIQNDINVASNAASTIH